jgi:hypothetical protein
MAFSAHFSVSQGSDATSFTLTDDSTGSDSNLTTRTISLFLADGSLLGGSTIAWPISEGATKALTGYLTRDYVINISVEWTSSSPIPGSTYTYAALFGFTGNTNAFIYGLIQQIAAQQSILNDTTFYEYLSKLQTEVDNCDQAVTYGDQFSGQAALDRAYAIILNSANYF